MEKTYIIVNMAYRFAALRGRRIAWVSEYPDATEWTSLREARKVLHSLKDGGHAAQIYSLIENYGLESQETIERLDLLA